MYSEKPEVIVFFDKTKKFLNSIISFQENFENINNKNYFLNYQKKIEGKAYIKIEKLIHYKRNFFNKNKHYYFFTKSKQ